MKLLIRTLLILVLMIGGSWLSIQLNRYTAVSGNLMLLSSVAMYAVYLLVGIVAGTMVSPRFLKNKNKWVYLIPIIIFVIVGSTPIFYHFLPMLPFPNQVAYLGNFTYLSWTLAGIYFTQAFR